MQIEHIQIQGFGAIAGDTSFEPDMNLIVAPNEAGKSTLAAALLALLYGVREARGQRWMATDDDARYRPLQGGAFAVAGIVRTQAGKRLNIWRDLDSDTLRVVDLESGKDVSADFARSPSGDTLGTSLLGLTRGQYEKLAFIRQDEVASALNFAEFADTIARLLSTEDPGVGTVQQALKDIEQARSKYPGLMGKGPIKLDTELSRLHEDLEQTQSQLHELEQQRLAGEAVMEEVSAQQLKNASLTEEVRKNEYLAALARETEINESIAARQEAMSAVREIEAEIRQLAPFGERDLDHGEELTGLSARIHDRSQSVEKLDQDLEEANERERLIVERMETLGERADVSVEALQEMDLDIERLVNTAALIESAHIDEKAAVETLAQLDITPESADHMQRHVMALEASDRQFLLSYTEDLSGLEAKRATFSQDLEAIQHSIAEIDSERTFAIKSARNHVILAIITLAVSLTLLFLLKEKLIFAPVTLVCMAYAIYGIIRIPAAKKLHSTERDYAENKLVNRQAILAELDLEIQEMKGKFRDLSAAFDLEYDSMLEKLRQYNQAQGAILTWRNTIERRADLERQREESADRLRELFSFCDLLEDNEELTVDVARRCANELHKSTGLQDELQQLRKDRQRLEEQRSLLHSEQATFQKRVRQILTAGGIPPETSYDEGVALYSGAARKKVRLLHLRDEQLPSTQRAAGSEGLIAALEAELMHVRKRRIELKNRHPHFEHLTAEESTAVYDERRAKAQQQLGKDAEMLAEREKELAVQMSAYREKAPGLQDRITELHAALRKAERFQSASSLAADILEQIAGDLYTRWSPILAEELNDDLDAYGVQWLVGLSRDLTLTVTPRDGGPALDKDGIDRHLSSGMREQIYLALRLLLTRHIGREEPLPLLLDDPFVNADDERFVAGMENLLECEATRNQILLFSCHALRYGQLAKLHPALKDAVVALPSADDAIIEE